MLSDYSPSRQTKNPKPADYESEAVGLKVRGRRTKRDYSMKYLRKIEEHRNVPPLVPSPPSNPYVQGV